MNLIVAALATWQMIEIWQHSRLMAPLRSRTEMWNNLFGELLGCPFCLSPWVGLFCMLTLTASVEEWGWLSRGGGVVIYSFAAARLANLGNDLFKQYCLTPKVTFDYDDEPDEFGGDSEG